ncbi:unnamed protein product [Paramecium primaurelia]|uniref:NFACT RNA-binding domain-containing protein n=2 Tax=Paramecium TaxID=5884 RepID=A0A8S1KAF3_PARPR|nr:unnamed protein product [Paramecium primaurelia]
MMKNKIRLTALDIMALVTELKQKLIGTRLSNIYNIDAKTYVFKFSLQESKSYLVIENGLRFNLSDTIEKNKVPSGFTMKFRKFLRSRRLESIEQIGVERVVVFTFGREDHTYYLILELYSQGNIILADKDYRIIQLTRQHEFSENAKVAPNEIYPFEFTATNYLEKFDTSMERIQKVISEKAGQKLKEVVFKLVPCLHQTLTDDIIQQLQMNQNEKIVNQFDNVKKVVDYAMEYINKYRSQTQYKGYLCAKEAPKDAEQKPKFFDFAADQPGYYQGKYVVETPTFNEAVHQYFLVVDRQEENKQSIEDIAWKKFENIKQDQMSRIQKLQVEQDEYIMKAGLIQENINDVQAIIDIIQKMIDNGIPWDKIQRMINDSKKEGNPLSNMIGGMNLKQNKVIILLGNKEDEYSDLVQIEIDITQSAYQNARKYYESKKKNRDKEIKTKEAVEQALKQAEKTALKEIEREKNKIQKVQNQRKKYWFEKFYWFISSDGYLVISGKDVQQNEMIVKRYMNKDDIYMHADIYGSASTIVKNPNEVPIPETTIMQAATATICRSKSWDAKIVVSAWWVHASQVSKSAPTGMNIPAGSFMIYGKKNFIYPPRLEMGCTILYQLDQDSIKRHEEERKKKLREEQSQVDETEQNESEITEKNILDSDNDDNDDNNNEDDNKVDLVDLEKTNSVQTIQQGDKEYTIVEVNPNARMIQQRNDKKQKEKDQQQKQQQQQQQQQQQSKQQQQQQQQSKQQQQQQQSKQQPKQQQQQPKQQEQKQNAKDAENDSSEDDKKNQKNPKTQQVRGKKNKMKKVKEKYADQSDEERELRQKLMGATYMKNEVRPEKKKKNQDKNESTKQDQDQPQQQEEQIKDKEYYKKQQLKQDSITNKLLKQQGIEVTKDEDKPDQQVQEVHQEKIEQQLQQNQQQLQQEVLQQKEPENLDNKQEEVDSDDEKQEKQPEQEEENIEYTEMQKLVSYLYADDKYLSLIPMVAPYSVIGTYKFKIKIAPGSLKKGKAGKEILNFFQVNKDITNQERQLLKMITDEEIVQTMLPGVKLTGVGMLQMKQKEKQLKKQQPKKNK